MGNEAPDRVLGPWVDELDTRVPADRRALLVALAAAAFIPPDDDTRTPFFQWCRRQPPPGAVDREMLRALERTPWSAWRIRALTPAGVELEDLVGLPARRHPEGPVPVDLVGALVPATPGDTLLARVARTRSGWEAATPLVVRGCPPEALLARWLSSRPARSGVEHWLSGSGHAFVRHVCEWAWRNR